MKKNKIFPKTIPIFPLSNFIIFPESSVPLNIFEPRYIQMIDDAMKGDRYIGMIQPKKSENQKKPELHQVGCMGKITSFNETDDGRYLIVLNGVSRFKILQEIETRKLYRECSVDYSFFENDLENKKDEIKFSDLEVIFKDLKSLFQKQGYIVNWKDLEKQSLTNTVNTLSMASPFSLEEKQILLEANSTDERRKKLEKILKNYIFDEYSNTTLQ